MRVYPLVGGGIKVSHSHTGIPVFVPGHIESHKGSALIYVSYSKMLVQACLQADISKLLTPYLLTQQGAVEEAAQRAQQLVVEECGHRPGAPFPPLPTAEDVARAAAKPRKLMVSRPDLKRPVKGTAASSSGLASGTATSAWNRGAAKVQGADAGCVACSQILHI